MYIGDLNALKKYQLWQVTSKLVIIFVSLSLISMSFKILIREILLYPKGEFANLDFFQVENQIT